MEFKMRKMSFMSAGVAGFGLSLICAAITMPAAAITMPANALVAPNGSFSFSLSPGNTVNTTNIARTTTSLTLGNVAPFPAITSLIDPFLGNPNNFCNTAGAGCTAAHPPGFLGIGDDVFFHNVSFPVGNIAPLPFALEVDASTRLGAPAGTLTVDFDFTSVFTSALTPTAANSFGFLTLGFLGTFASAPINSYFLGQAADMSITCTQPTVGAAITCGGTIDTPAVLSLPPPAVPEPASLALLGSALFGFGVFRRRRGSKSR